MAIFEGGHERWDYRPVLLDAIALVFAGLNAIAWPFIFFALVLTR